MPRPDSTSNNVCPPLLDVVERLSSLPLPHEDSEATKPDTATTMSSPVVCHPSPQGKNDTPNHKHPHHGDSTNESPIDILPLDILSTIFETVVSSSTPPSLPMSHRHPAVILSHVSQPWRALALGTPALWRYLNIDIPPYPQPDTESFSGAAGCDDELVVADLLRDSQAALVQAKETMKAWLDRSSNYALDIRISLRMVRGHGLALFSSAAPYVLPVIELLRGATARWRAVTLIPTWFEMPDSYVPGFEERSTTTLLDALLHIEASQLPVLQSLSFEAGADELHFLDGPPMLLRNSGIFRAPALRRLSIHRLSSKLAELPIPWAHLTHFRFGGYLGGGSAAAPRHFGPSEVFTLLLACPNLVECELSKVRVADTCTIMYPEENPRAPWPPKIYSTSIAHLDQLASFSLQSDSFLPDAFLQALRMPRLRVLHLQRGRATLPNACAVPFPASTVNWVRMVGAHLTALTVELDNHDYAVIYECLRGIPNVEELSVTTAPVIRIVPDGVPWAQHVPLDVVEAASNYLVQALTARVSNRELDGSLMESQCVLCPRLRSFTCVFKGPGCGEDVLVAFIASRRIRGSAEGLVERIENVTISHQGLKDRDIHEKLRAMPNVDLVDLKLHVRSPDPLAT